MAYLNMELHFQELPKCKEGLSEGSIHFRLKKRLINKLMIMSNIDHTVAILPNRNILYVCNNELLQLN